MQTDRHPVESESPNGAAPRWSCGRFSANLVFGFLLPIACLALDPIVFRSSIEPAFFGRLLPFAFTSIGISWVSLALWMSMRRGGGVLAGFMYAGGVLAFLLGFTILPMTLLGLLLVIGVLGFTPFATAYVFCRSAQKARKSVNGGFFSPAVVAGFLIAIAIPASLQLYVVRVVDRATVLIVDGDGFDAKTALTDLMWVDRWFGSHLLARKYIDHKAHRDSIASFYREVTGEPITNAFGPMSDGPLFDDLVELHQNHGPSVDP